MERISVHERFDLTASSQDWPIAADWLDDQNSCAVEAHAMRLGIWTPGPLSLDGYGNGNGDGSGDGHGSGYGHGNGSGNGHGYGYGNGYGNGNGHGDGSGNGDGSG